jgi:hypothetical protein
MWLKDHVYLATWLSALLAVVTLIWNLTRTASRGQPINITRIVVIFICISSFPVAVTPTFDSSARTFAQYVFSLTLVMAVMMRHE